jgi:hypothetical protein
VLSKALAETCDDRYARNLSALGAQFAHGLEAVFHRHHQVMKIRSGVRPTASSTAARAVVGFVDLEAERLQQPPEDLAIVLFVVATRIAAAGRCNPTIASAACVVRLATASPSSTSISTENVLP